MKNSLKFITIFSTFLSVSLAASAADRNPKNIASKPITTRSLAEDELRLQAEPVQTPENDQLSSPATIQLPKIKLQRPSSLGVRQWILGWQTFNIKKSNLLTPGLSKPVSDISIQGYGYFSVHQPVWFDAMGLTAANLLASIGYGQASSDIELLTAKLGATIKRKLAKNYSVELAVFNEFHNLNVTSNFTVKQANYSDQALGTYLAINKKINKQLALHINYEYLLPSKNTLIQSNSGIGLGIRGHF